LLIPTGKLANEQTRLCLRVLRKIIGSGFVRSELKIAAEKSSSRKLHQIASGNNKTAIFIFHYA